MRIVVVSAHYPPNFVSGGTLAAQRVAHGLRDRGHDVTVFAGHLDDTRPLESWDEHDDRGMRVRWIATGRWIGWDDPLNFDNPPVTAAFGDLLAEVRPDLVHFHAMQSLGAGLVDAAADAGARVVVTMHDFWWLCPRQFLVNRAHQPCCLVVSCGVCPCQVDRPWLEARNRRLARRVERADLVLAVSGSEAEVLAANGVDPARLRVDENGVPEPPGAAGPRPAGPAGGDGVVRFLYVGGWNRMKGPHVLVEAARRVAARAGRDGWRLLAYGLAGGDQDDFPAELAASGLPAESRPPFDPSTLEAVFGEADVLVVPSVMRETFSLVTREALTRGLPVVCTDTLGPEEAVDDGVNGLVVPADDAEHLAAAMARFVQEPDLLDRLRRGCHGVQVRPVDDQLDGLDATFRALVEGEGPSPAAGRDTGRRPVARVLFVVGIHGAPLRYRAQLPAEALALLGVESDVRYYRAPDLDELAERADAVVVYRVPGTIQVAGFLARARERGTPLFFDVDDLIFDPHLADEIPALKLLPPDEAELWMQGVRRYRTTMEACDAFIGSTASLCAHAEQVTGLPAHRFPNGVGIALARRCDEALARPRTDGPLRIGYLSGTTTHDHDWLHVEPAVVRVLDEHPDVELWLGGLVNPTAALDRFGARVRRLPFMDWTELPGVLRDLDVNLAPLEPGSRFNEAKSAIKWLEAALVATPTVASPTEPFVEAIDPGRDGILAEDPADWAAAITALLDDDLLRARIGARARRTALLRWSPHLQARRYLDILETGELRRPGAGGAWEPVLLDEPAEEVALDPYPPGPAAPPPAAGAPLEGVELALTGVAGRRERAGRLGRRARDVLADEGPVEAVRRATAVARRQWPKLERRVRGRSRRSG